MEDNNEEKVKSTNSKSKKFLNLKKKLSKKSVNKAKVATALGPVIMWGIIIILVIIMIIGIIMFFVTMPSMVMQKLKKISSTLGNYVAAFFGADANKQIDSGEIFNTLNYMEEMGYDVKGFGFLTDYITAENVSQYSQGLPQNYTVDDKTGVVRDEEGKIILAKSDFIFTYIASDNYIYTIKNTNIVTQGGGGGGFFGFIDQFISGVVALKYKIHNFLFYRLDSIIGITQSAQDAWGKGLINVYYQGGGVGVKGNPYTPGFFNFDSVRIDTDKKELILKKGDWFANNQEVGYSLDGWTGRYGMPLEFLMAVHLATMMPDLAYDMATTFPTNVNIILNPINGNTAYQPYIVDVTNHWYRDVYYAVDLADISSKGINMVDYDYDYQAIYKERWTLYETFSDADDSSEYADYAKDNFGEYKLFIINKDGEYITDAELAEIKDNSKVKKDIHEGYIYLGTREEASKDNIIVTKKAVKLDFSSGTAGGNNNPDGGNDDSSNKTFEDLNWNFNGVWSAYTKVELWDGNIKQTGEGMRAETNPQIKKMFLNNVYFRYDGSQNTAEIITALRKMLKTKISNSTSEYGALNALTTSGSQLLNGYSVPKTYDFTENDAYNQTFTAKELGLGDEDKEYKISDFTGQVSLNQDSLNAFSMLENMHTLDADYIYRDFKELIVELGYFSKEELTDEVPRVMQWIVPEIGSQNYPERELDKRENEFGTMIHSKGDIDAYKAYAGTKILDTIPDKVGIKSPDFTTNGYYRRLTGEVTKDDGSYYKVPGDMFIVRTEPSDYKITGTLEEIAEVAKQMWLGMANVTDSVSYKKSSSEFAATYLESQKDSGKRNVNDAVFVSWVLKNLGADIDEIIARFEGDWTNSHDIARLCVEDLGAEIIFNYRELEPGDIMAYVFDEEGDEVELVDILGEQRLDGSYLRYGGDVLPNIGDTSAKDSIDEDTFNQLPLCFGMRISYKGYTGYKGNEMVVSPVTGILLEYGTYQSTDVDSITGEEYRTNVDLKYGSPVVGKEIENKSNIVSDKVGYAKILVLDKENYSYLEHSSNNRWNEHDGDSTSMAKVQGEFDESRDTLNTSAKWNDLDKTIYAYKEFAESYEEAGIAGNIIYIDGFVCEEPDEKLKDIINEIPNGNSISLDYYKKITLSNLTDRTIQLPSKYIEDEYYDMASTKAQDKHKAESIMKMNSAHSIYLTGPIYGKEDVSGIDSLIFIKEGTILGRTMTDKELLEKNRNGRIGSYVKNRQVSLGIDKEAEDTIIGNYLRVIMRDGDKTPVEDVEDFYKLGAREKYDWFSILLWVPFESGGVDRKLEGPENIDTCTPGELAVGIAQWTDLLMHYQRRNGNGINAVLRRCVKDDYDLCWPLEEHITSNIARWRDCTKDPLGNTGQLDYISNQLEGGEYWDGGVPGLKGKWDYLIKVDEQSPSHPSGYGHYENGVFIPDDLTFINCRWDGSGYAEAIANIRASKLQEALTKVCNMNREKFFRLQRQLAKEAFLDPVLVNHPWVADRPLCIQGVLLHIFLAGDQSIKWITEDMSNEKILEEVSNHIASRKSTSSDPTNDPNSGRAWTEPEIARKILNGTLPKNIVEMWVREGRSCILKEEGVDVRGGVDAGSIAN